MEACLAERSTGLRRSDLQNCDRTEISLGLEEPAHSSWRSRSGSRIRLATPSTSLSQQALLDCSGKTGTAKLCLRGAVLRESSQNSAFGGDSLPSRCFCANKSARVLEGKLNSARRTLASSSGKPLRWHVVFETLHCVKQPPDLPPCARVFQDTEEGCHTEALHTNIQG